MRNLLLIAAMISGLQVRGQQRTESIYDPASAFAPLPAPPGNLVRTAAGVPGSQYWQNRADYDVSLTLDTLTRAVTGQITMLYTNNSPDALTYLWLAAAQNRFRKDARETLLTPVQGSRFGTTEFTDGLVLETVQANNKPVAYDVAGTLIKIKLAQPLLPGKQVRLHIAYQFTLPVTGADYMGILKTPYGQVFQYSNSFPRMCVYDDLRGWNVSTSYYIEPGSLDLRVTVPSNMIVQGTGMLANPEEVLSATVLQRYRQALNSDKAIRVRTTGETVSPAGANTRTWHFRSPNTGDALFAASASFNWDMARTQLPGGKNVATMALYPPGSHQIWDTLVTAMQRMIGEYSKQWGDYPYASMVNIGGSVTGLAGPGATFINHNQSPFAPSIWIKTNHELGHNWFNMLVAADNRYGWMCEGFNTFINLVNADSLGGARNFKMEDILTYIGKPGKRAPIHSVYGSIPLQEMGLQMYSKPAVALYLLRTDVLGPQRFDEAFRHFIASWAYKHPAAEDFFRVMNNAAGEDLSWFWRAWFITDARLDQSIEKVEYVLNDPAKGILVTLANKLAMPMPVNLLVREFNGQLHHVHLPAQTWESAIKHTLKVPSTSPVVSVLLDPQQMLPDEDRSNNKWSGGEAKLRKDKALSAREVINHYLDAIGGRDKVAATQNVSLEYYAEQVLSIHQQYGQNGHYSWLAELKDDKVRLSLKDVRRTDSLQFWQFNQPKQLTGKEQDELRHAAALFPELDFFATGNKVSLSDSLYFIHGVDAYQVTLTTAAGNSWKFYYDVVSGLKVRETFAGQGKPLLYDSKVLSGYDTINGIKMPRQLGLNEDGTKEEQYELKTFIKS